jgi:hypothetical protein
MKHYETAASSNRLVERLDQIRMSPEARRSARASILQGELIAGMLMRANEDFRHAFGFVRRAVGALGRRSKVSAAVPEFRLP